ncbi:MAG: glutamate--tRNA ligase [Deltaproteobacteria bacterium]|nr:glutamate--tRNA ligase [Deltaproteobacteria bacterium]
MSAVRTRFAPSPTGFLHIGGARTALFNFLFARHHGGVFVLRVEDTDRERSTAASTDAIFDSLRWLGLEWDEGPFFQSERTALYRDAAARLLAGGHAYRCTCTAEALEQQRQAAQAAGGKPMYDRRCREAGHSEADAPFTIRFKTPLVGETVVDDALRGPVIFQNQEIDDLIIVRSDGSPTYNFCVVVDDALMAITHNIRGDDHLANTPKQVLIYQALGYPTPRFAHVPLILGLDRARLSKRHGATSVLSYREAGILPEALNNYLARLGWSAGDQEIFSGAELIEKFSLEHVGASAGVFNPEKLEWVNAQHLKRRTPAELVPLLKPFLAERGWTIPGDDTWLARLIGTLQERARTLDEMAELAAYFFSDTVAIDPAAAAKHLGKANRAALLDLRDALAGLPQWTTASIEAAFQAVLARHAIGLGKLAQPVRVALTGGTVSPGIYEVAEVLGPARTVARLDAALPLVGGADAA